jgi:hypothetical protein
MPAQDWIQVEVQVRCEGAAQYGQTGGGAVESRGIEQKIGLQRSTMHGRKIWGWPICDLKKKKKTGPFVPGKKSCVSRLIGQRWTATGSSDGLFPAGLRYIVFTL